MGTFERLGGDLRFNSTNLSSVRLGNYFRKLFRDYLFC